MIRNDVEVSFLDGESLRGTVDSFNPQRPTLYLHGAQPGGEETSREIGFNSVKMIAFLRNPDVQKNEMTFPATARLVTVRFFDREVIRGVTQSYAGNRVGLFLIPTAPGHVDRIFIPVTAIRDVISVRRLGEILSEEGMATPEMIEKAMERQQELREEPIGQILVKQQVISDQQLEKGLSLQKQRAGKKIGEILIEQGFIESVQLDEALAAQRGQRGKKLGEIMVEMGYATFKMIGIALAIQFNMPFIDLSSQAFDPQLHSLVSKEIATRWQIMPLNLQEKILTIAVADPIDHGAQDEIREKTGLTVMMVVSTPQDISRAISRHYGSSASTA